MNTTNQPDFKNMSEEYKKKLRLYFLQCMLSEGSKILIFAFIAVILQVFTEFLTAMALLILLRTNGGGLHFKHYISCFLMSFFVLFGSVFLGIYAPTSSLAAGIFVLLSVPIGYLCVPVASENRPPVSERVIKKSKRNTVVVLIIYFILICIVPMNRYVNIGVWIITIHVGQLLLAKYLKRRKAACQISTIS